MSLVNCWLVHYDGLHPLSYKKIYEAVVLPKNLYGCETCFLTTNNIVLQKTRTKKGSSVFV